MFQGLRWSECWILKLQCTNKVALTARDPLSSPLLQEPSPPHALTMDPVRPLSTLDQTFWAKAGNLYDNVALRRP